MDGSAPGPAAHPTGDGTVGVTGSRAASVLAALSGPPPGGLEPPPTLLAGLMATGARIEGVTRRWGAPVECPWPDLLTERATLGGLVAQGRTSCGGATRLLRSLDGWVAVSLARPTDVELLPAWLALTGADAAGPDPRWPPDEDTWDVLARSLRRCAAPALATAAGVVGLPVGVLGERGPDPDGGVAVHAIGPGAKPGPPATVLDLSTLWAGPLCGRLLGAAGATVLKVTATLRPDGARSGDAAWYEALNGDKHHVELPLHTPAGRRELRGLIGSVDVVVESARPRGLEQMGIVATDVLARGTGPRAWVSITGHGRPSARVAFGDDAAVAGGLVVTDDDGPWFCADAIADPLSGIAAADATLACLAGGRRALVEVAMAGVAAAHAAPTPPGP